MRDEDAGFFRARFGSEPRTHARAPGRVNLIGEHTDYNEGLVLPCAIDRDTRVLLRPRSDTRVRVVSSAFAAAHEFDSLQPARRGAWIDYVQGVFHALAARGHVLPGFEIAIASELPAEAGLSSSAALELALVCGLDHALGLGLGARERCDIAHAAEAEFVGVPCGIMDQYVVGLARAGAALRIDCRTRAVETVGFPDDRLAILIADSGLPRALAGGAFAERTRECAAVRDAAVRAGCIPASAGLSQLTRERLEGLAPDLPPTLVRRARHVLGENARVERVCEALRSGDLAAVGATLSAGMRSLREDFEVSTPELDLLCEAGDAAAGVYGSRLTGAGFGGCCLHLVDPACADDAAEAIARAFASRFGRRPAILRAATAAGANAQASPRAPGAAPG